jgi:gas vesicle protein
MNANETSRGPGFGHLFIALLGGAAAGAAVAYLTAPRSGAESRERIQALAEDTRDTVGRVPEALRKATQAAREAFNEALKEDARA